MQDNHVLLVDKERNPLNPVSPERAQYLLRTGQAAKLRHQPLVLIMKRPIKAYTKLYRLKIDPGSRFTGFVITDIDGRIIYAMELEHRGEAIKQELIARAAIRRNRRNRKTGYRQARFDNRSKKPGWLPPCIQHRIDTTLTWIERFIRWAPIGYISLEHAKFDMKAIKALESNQKWPDNSLKRQYEARAYLAELYQYKCMYCDGNSADRRMEIEHKLPRSKGGTDNLSNLGYSCRSCNQAKGNQTIEDFLKHDPVRLKQINKLSKVKLKDAAVVNSSRLELVKQIKAYGLRVELGTGAQTAFNRRMLKMPKAHWSDAACIGESGSYIRPKLLRPLVVKAMGHGHRRVVRSDKYGFPASQPRRSKSIPSPLGLIRTGDIVDVVVTSGKYIGQYFATRIAAIKTLTGYVSIKLRDAYTNTSKIVDISIRTIVRILQRNDGYQYPVAI